jgi:hypothetical protein
LHHWDDIDGFNISPISSAEQINVRWLFSIARIVLVNWLSGRPGPSGLARTELPPSVIMRLRSSV